MHDRERDNFYIVHIKRTIIDDMHAHIGDTRILNGHESVIVILMDGITGSLIAIDINISSFYPIKSSYIIQSPGMIFVFMCQKNGPHVLYVCP